jgi:3-dehydroquinate synthase II
VKPKEIVIHIPEGVPSVEAIVKYAVEKGVQSFYTDVPIPSELVGSETTIFSPSSHGEVLVVSPDQISDLPKGTEFAMEIELLSKAEEDKVLQASQLGASAVFVKLGKDKIIPLENLVASLHKTKTRIYTWIKDISEVETLLTVLELGIEGVVVSPQELDDIDRIDNLIQAPNKLELATAEIIEKTEAGLGDRACVDTAILLEEGEGVLVGSQAGFLFLINAETTGSAFSAPRPFRINAGPVHSYVLMPDDKTTYLSELECGSKVLVVNNDGTTREAVVGRVKIEKRPLFLVVAEANGVVGKILVQNAETIRFATPDRDAIPVTELNTGDQVLVQITAPSGRHFGVAVDESVREV